MDLVTAMSTNDWWLEKMSVVLDIQDHGCWACDLFDNLPNVDKICVVKEIGIFVIWIVSDGSRVQAKRNHKNATITIEEPPVMPAKLVKMQTGAFISNVLDPFHQHLEKF